MNHQNEVERDLQSLRDGTGRYSTPKEDAILLSIVGAVALALIGGIWLCIHYIGVAR